MFDRLLTALIDNNKPHLLFEVKDEWLEGTELAQVLFVRDYLIKYGELPGYDVINRRFQLNLPVPGGRWAYELKLLKERHIYLSLSRDLPPMMSGLRKDPMGTAERLRQLLNNLEAGEKHKDSYYHEETDERMLEYRLRVGNRGVIHLSTGFEALDENMYGYYPIDLITLGGRAGQLKTWSCCVLALAAESVLPASAGPILFLSNEISREEIKGRMDCIRFKLNYERFLKGALTRPELKRYQEGLTALKAAGSRIIIIDGVTTLDEWRGKIKLYRPSLGFVDGSYLLEPEMEEGYKKIIFITRGLKKIAKDEICPTFNTTQLKKATGTKQAKSSYDAQDDFAWGSSYSQDSDIAWTSYQTPQMQYAGYIGWQYAKGRRVKPGTELLWRFDLDSMNMVVQVATAGEDNGALPFVGDDSPAVF